MHLEICNSINLEIHCCNYNDFIITYFTYACILSQSQLLIFKTLLRMKITVIYSLNKKKFLFPQILLVTIYGSKDKVSDLIYYSLYLICKLRIKLGIPATLFFHFKDISASVQYFGCFSTNIRYMQQV